MQRPIQKRGFTLIELMVVIAVVTTLVSLLLPAVQAARETSRRLHCTNNLKQIAMALHNYHDANGILPSGQYFCKPGTDCSDRPYFAPGWGWSASILPQLEQATIYDELRFTLSMRDASNVPTLATPIATFQCPSDVTRRDWVPPSGLSFRPEKIATSNYCGNGGSFGFSFQVPALVGDDRATNGVFGRDSARRFVDVTDGLSNTFLVGEVVHYNFPWDPTLYGHWDPPSGTACCTLSLVRLGAWKLNPGPSAPQIEQRESFSSLHDGGANFAMCDGSVRFVSELIDTTSRQLTTSNLSDPFDVANAGADYRVWQRLFSRNDSMTVNAF